jgi:hypothetical protein
MANDIAHDTILELRTMFRDDPAARALFEWAAARKNDASETSIAYLAQRAETTEANATKLARRLDELGCGEYIVGRRGGTSRIVWDYSLKSIGKAAKSHQGESAVLEPKDPDLAAESVEDRGSAEAPLTIAQAKKRLAIALGVSPESIEIVVRA